MRTDLVKTSIEAALQALRCSNTTMLQSVLRDSLDCIKALERDNAKLQRERAELAVASTCTANGELVVAAQAALRSMDRWADLLGDIPPFDKANMPTRSALRTAIANAVAQTKTPARGTTP